MQVIFDTLENTFNKSTIKEFRQYLSNFSDIKKWMIFSDYCINDPQKPNNCITFVIYPYILDLETIQSHIQEIAKVDLKHTRTINSDLCNFYKSGLIYSFNFILEDKNYFSQRLSTESIQSVINTYLNMLDTWDITTPQNKATHDKIRKNFKSFLNETKRKSFNRSLAEQIFTTTFLASYVIYLLIRECTVDLVSWFSDTDNITTGFKNLIFYLFLIQPHCLCVQQIGDTYKQPKLGFSDGKKPMFYEQMNRLADYICGFISEFDMNIVPKSYPEKYCYLADQVVADNKNICVLRIKPDGVDKVVHSLNF